MVSKVMRHKSLKHYIGKFYVPTCPIFTGLVTNVISHDLYMLSRSKLKRYIYIFQQHAFKATLILLYIAATVL